MPRQKKPPWETETIEEARGDITPQDPIKRLIDRKPFHYTEDKRGHHATLGARMPKNYTGWVQRLVEHGGEPYKGHSDVIRDAIYLGLIVISMRLGMSAEWRAEEDLAAIRGLAEERERIITRTEGFIKDIDKQWRSGDQDRAYELLNNYVGVCYKMQQSDDNEESWRGDRYMNALRGYGVVRDILRHHGSDFLRFFD